MVGGYIRNRGTPKLPSINHAYPVQLVLCALIIPTFLFALFAGIAWLQVVLLVALALIDAITDVLWFRKIKNESHVA
jgi:membrane protein implicated in regulation of membrane protease activity